MDDAFACGFAEIPHGNAELGFRRRRVSLRNDFAKLSNFRSDTRLHTPIAGAPLDILTVTLDC